LTFSVILGCLGVGQEIKPFIKVGVNMSYGYINIQEDVTDLVADNLDIFPSWTCFISVKNIGKKTMQDITSLPIITYGSGNRQEISITDKKLIRALLRLSKQKTTKRSINFLGCRFFSFVPAKRNLRIYRDLKRLEARFNA